MVKKISRGTTCCEAGWSVIASAESCGGRRSFSAVLPQAIGLAAHSARKRKYENERTSERRAIEREGALSRGMSQKKAARGCRPTNAVRIWCRHLLPCSAAIPPKLAEKKRAASRLCWGAAHCRKSGGSGGRAGHALAMTRGRVTHPKARSPLPNSRSTSASASAGSPVRRGPARSAASPNSRSRRTCSRSRC